MPQPNKIPLAFAASGDKNVIPESTETTGLASWREGFPAITSAPFSEGGIAPKRADFNGIFNALSQAVMWMQQGGVYAYDVTTDYEAGNVVLDAGGLYVANSANGPSSAVVQPSTDTTGATWKLVRLDLATQSAAGYMSASDKTIVDSIPELGTFSKMFFSQTSGTYIAPRTGIYRITLKGGGGGGGGANTASFFGGGGGGEGGRIRFYVTLTQGQSYPYVIGAGGAAGSNTTTSTAPPGASGGITSFNNAYSVRGGGGGGNQNSASIGGIGGMINSAPSGATVEVIPGANGADGINGRTGWYQAGAKGGGKAGSTQGGVHSAYGGGGDGGGGYFTNAGYEPQPGADGYILIEYAG